MKASLRWLNDHLDLSAKSIPEMAALLTAAGIEVEGIQCPPDHVVVARIESSERHPDADKLSVCQVNDGGATPRQIVCGAKNYEVGDHVPLALPGARIGDMVIKTGKLRGVESQGMLCSARELGLSEDASGLLILPRDLPPGTSFAQVHPPVFDLEITPNRPDLLSHLGLARELSALTGIRLKRPPVFTSTAPGRAAKSSEISLQDRETCSFYSARILRGVKVGPSPDWLRDKLQAIGLRPINNVVDITNFILMEMGQPLHAFDLSLLKGGIRVRRAGEGEKFTALDGRTHLLTPDDCVIADSKGAQALGGVMGGESSGVTEATTDILLEAAYFEPSLIRRTSHRHGIHTDSSYRFERGVDPAQVMAASEAAARLVLELAGGQLEGVPVWCGELPSTSVTVPLDNALCRRLLGSPIPPAEIGRILKAFGLQKESDGWRIPSYRLDLRRPVDLVEEVARVHGLDRIPGKTTAPFVPPSRADQEYDFRRALRTRLGHLGFHECQTIKLISEAQLALDVATQHRNLSPLRVKNPMTEPHTFLRPGLTPSLLRIAEHNVRMGTSDLRLFEIGTVFAASPKGQPIELQHLALVATGRLEPPSWRASKPDLFDFAALRGLLEQLCPGQAIDLLPIEDPRLLLAAEIKVGGGKVGLAGCLLPATARSLDLDQPVLVAEIGIKKLMAALGSPSLFHPLPRFPAITRDVAIEAPADLPGQAISDFFQSSGEPLLESFRLFDLFVDPTGTRLAADRKSLAWSLTYRSATETLAAPQVDAAHGRLLDRLKAALPITFR
ncbi:MAG: phenylalanine--tRNA ligase subunit beta [Verrucomicrobia bacterium]|nr:phenylalanine--tRNA ligase subunit beta [Verrucomicrobiota bacterium]